jgi:hypothetical protein
MIKKMIKNEDEKNMINNDKRNDECNDNQNDKKNEKIYILKISNV